MLCGKSCQVAIQTSKNAKRLKPASSFFFKKTRGTVKPGKAFPRRAKGYVDQMIQLFLSIIHCPCEKFKILNETRSETRFLIGLSCGTDTLKFDMFADYKTCLPKILYIVLFFSCFLDAITFLADIRIAKSLFLLFVWLTCK